MLIVMKAGASEEQIAGVCRHIESLGLKPHPIPGAQRTAIGITGNKGALELSDLAGLDGVAEALRVSKPYKLVSLEVKPEKTVIPIGPPELGITIGGPEWVVMAGPCAVENREQTLRIAEQVAAAGARMFRGGAFKPRTSPYSFQGMGEAGLEILAEVRERFGLGIVTEAVDEASLALVEQYADMIQLGARNMQNYALLRRAGKARKPVMLKRGLAATLEEWLMAAEYLLSEGNYQVALCERGVRTFSDHSRNTLDLTVVPAVQEVSHLPVLVDPSHGTGRRDRVVPLARAALAVGADGLLVEVHDTPDRALSDGIQSIYPRQLEQLMAEARGLAPLLARRMPAPASPARRG